MAVPGASASQLGHAWCIAVFFILTDGCCPFRHHVYIPGHKTGNGQRQRTSACWMVSLYQKPHPVDSHFHVIGWKWSHGHCLVTSGSPCNAEKKKIRVLLIKQGGIDIGHKASNIWHTHALDFASQKFWGLIWEKQDYFPCWDGGERGWWSRFTQRWINSHLHEHAHSGTYHFCFHFANF